MSKTRIPILILSKIEFKSKKSLYNTFKGVIEAFY